MIGSILHLIRCNQCGIESQMQSNYRLPISEEKFYEICRGLKIGLESEKSCKCLEIE